MTTPAILFYDLETSPNIGYTWRKYDQTVMEFTQQSVLMSVAYKWADEDDVTVDQLCDYEDYDPTSRDSRWDDESLTRDLFDLLDRADVVIGHNARGFDNKYAHSRFLYHGLGTPSPYTTVDTLTLCRSNFRMNSNKLGDVGDYLGLGGKKATGGFQTWLSCLDGDYEAWETMRAYAAQDVVLLEAIYERLRPYVRGLNFGLFRDEEAASCCPVCGSEKFKKNGRAYRQTRTYQRYRCECGKFFSSTKSISGVQVK